MGNLFKKNHFHKNFDNKIKKNSDFDEQEFKTANIQIGHINLP